MSAGGIQILNGVVPKQPRDLTTGVLHTNKTLRQHPSLGFEGTTYNAPFTESAVPPFPTNLGDNATQVVLPPQMPGSQPGTSVPVAAFGKLHPTEAASSFNSEPGSTRSLVHASGGPSPQANTPFHPNAAKTARHKAQVGTTRVIRSQPSTEHNTAGSYAANDLAQPTLTGHGPAQANRWATTKTGAAG